jgi:hypothetical protein
MKHHFLKFLMILVVATLIVASSANAAPTTARLAATVSYTADFPTVFPNPERGYHNRYEIINDPAINAYVTCNNPMGPGCPPPDQVDRTFSRAKGLGNTIIHSYIHLDMFQNTDTLPQTLLDNLSSGLAAIRTAGLKIILRPAYEWAGSPSVPEARILGHIAQLNPIISANADVVLHLEAGYLGPWGEWHTSLYTDPFNQEYASPRYHIAKKILDTTPDILPIVIRYPIFIKEFTFPPSCVVTGGCTMTQVQQDRIGFHNDCFLSDSADMGTYDNNSWMGWFDIAVKRQWMYDLSTSFGTNKMMGGETCNSSGDNDAAGVNVQNYMSLLNTTEINEDYAPVNTDIWKAANLAASGNDPAETAFVRLKRKMGYRLRLNNATFPTSATAGGSYTFSASLNNDGYSGIIKQRPIYLVFKSGANRFNVQMTGVDVRTWLSGPVTVAQQTVTLPSNMPAGTYTLALWLPDYYTGLQSRPEYSIRFANQGIWDATNGYNVLSNAITIGGGCAPNCPTNTPGPTPTNTPTASPTPTKTNTPSVSPLMIDSFSDATKWGTNHLNDLNKTVSWVMDNAYYNTANPGDIVLNSSPANQYYQETITQSLNGVNLVLRLRDWSDTDTENHWNVVLNDGTDHTVALNTYANVTGTYTNFNIPLSAFGANLANTQYLRIVHKDATYAVLLIDTISIDGGGPTSTPAPTNTNTPVPPTNTPTNTPVATNTPTNTSIPPTNTPTNTPVGPTNTPTNTPVATNTPTNTPIPPTNTPTNTPVGPTNTPTRTPTPGAGTSYEAEAAGNTLGGGATIQSCTACSGGQRVNSIGFGISNAYLIFNNVNVAIAGNHTVVVWYTNGNNTSLTFHADPNGVSGPTTTVPSNGGFDWTQPVLSINITLNLNAGNNTIKIWDTNKAPDIDRIVVQ